MATHIGIAFPWGRYHGTPWGRNVNEGAVDWPPEPWRILRALYATWRARAPELDTDVVTALLDALAEPPTFTVPAHRLGHTRHYYPDAKHGPRVGTDKVFDTFAVMERGAELTVSWPADLPEPQRSALAVLCERLTYLGRADSICIARLLDDEPSEPAADSQIVHPLDVGDIGADHHQMLASRAPVALADLEVRPHRLRRKGHLEPPGSRRVAYARARAAEPQQARPPRRAAVAVSAVRLRLISNALPAVTAAVAVAHVTRAAALDQLDAARTGAYSQALSGRDEAGNRIDTNHEHAHYLPFVSRDGAVHDPRHLDTVVIWAPGGLSADDLSALAGIRFLRPTKDAGFRRCRAALEAAGTLADVAPELAGPARQWQSFTPYAPPRHVRRQKTWADHAHAYLARDLAASSYVPAAIEPYGAQWLSFRRHRPGNKERLADARRATGFTITFDEPISGPLALGALRHFGLGLFIPTTDTGR